MRKIIGVLILAFLSVTLMGCSVDPIQEMRSQLEELDSTSYSALRDWMESDLPVFKEEYERQLEGFEVNVRTYDAGGNLIAERFMENDARFIQWSFDLDEDGLDVEVTYLNYDDYISAQLQGIDENSLLDIMKWVEDYKGNMDIEITILDDRGNEREDFEPLEGRDFFLEWNYSIDGSGEEIALSMNYVFELTRTITVGDSITLSDIKFTFFDIISGRRVDDYYSIADGTPYFAVRANIENVGYERRDIFGFSMFYTNPRGEKHFHYGSTREGCISRKIHLEPGEVYEGYVFFRYDRDGDYILEIYDREEQCPFMVKVIIPIYDIDFPERVEREQRDVYIPEVVFDLEEGDIILFDHDLSSDSFFYSVPYTSELGNTYMILIPNEIVRDPAGVITHDSLRIAYTFLENTSEGGFEGAVDRMEWIANDMQQGGRPRVIIGNIRATEDGQMAFMHTRSGAVGDRNTRLLVIQMLGDGSEFLIFEVWLWVINEEFLEGERRSAVEEFGRITGIDFIEILRQTYEGR